MALEDYFLTPIGLLALASLAVLAILYFISRKPSSLSIPTIRFLVDDPQRAGSTPRLNTFRRSLLLLLQALVLVAVSMALAGPYLTTPGGDAGGSAVVVVDASASMATRGDGATRFDRAVAAAREGLPATTSVVIAGANPYVAVSGAPASRAAAALETVSVSETPGDLRSAVALATSIAGENERIVVYSDFADVTDWRAGVEEARARGHPVELVQFDGGGRDNVGIVGLDFGRTTVTASVTNAGQERATRTVSLGDQSRSVTLAPGDVTTVSFDVPSGGGRITLSPGDSFPVDDVAYVAAADTDAIRVLVLTNDENRYLTTALQVIDEVEVTVETLPTPVRGEYDVVVFDDVDPDRLLAGNLESAREVLRAGGGVVVTAQENLQAVPYGSLLLLDPGTVESSGQPPAATGNPITEGISFPPPESYVTGELATGRALLRASDGTPLLAVDAQDGGQVVYYGYLDDASDFRFNYLYPVFWKRLTYFAAGRQSIENMNRATGDSLSFQEPTTVETPRGTVTARTIPLDRVGVYSLGNFRIGASLLSPTESAVSVQPVGDDGDGTVVVAPERQPPPSILSLVPYVAAVGLALLVLELYVLYRRGDV